MPDVKMQYRFSSKPWKYGGQNGWVFISLPEQCTVYQTNESLTYELTACSFPVHKLKHSYSFENMGNKTKVTQTMQYEMKFGLFGKLMDAMMVRKQSDKGIKKFFAGLKSFVEKN